MPGLTLFDGQPDAVTKGERNVTKHCCLMISELPPSYVSARGGRRRCNDSPAIDIRHPRVRELIDRPEGRISWQFNRNSLTLCYVNIVFHRDHAVLTDVTDHVQPKTLSISLLRTLCNYGGWRSWFACPGCSQRCAKLYFDDGRVLCRSCLGLAYRSQLQASAERPRLIAQRIRRGLGGSPSLFEPFPAKPPRMHWRTYDRIRENGERYEARAVKRLADWLER